jgi:hypothetical protein
LDEDVYCIFALNLLKERFQLLKPLIFSLLPSPIVGQGGVAFFLLPSSIKSYGC